MPDGFVLSCLWHGPHSLATFMSRMVSVQTQLAALLQQKPSRYCEGVPRKFSRPSFRIFAYLQHPYFRGLAPATLPLCGPSPPSPKLGPRSSSGEANTLVFAVYLGSLTIPRRPGAAGLPPPIPHSGAPLLVPSSVPVPFPSAASTEDDTADAQDGAEGDGGDNATGKPLKRKK